MTQPSSRPAWPTLLLVAVLVLLGCGSTTTIVSGGPTAAATSTLTPTPLPPTATPPPGHMLVTVHPIECSGGGTCAPYVCHTGTTCVEQGICTASSWPTFTLSNSGSLSVTWHAMMDGHAAPTTGWTLSATSGTLAGGATSATITVNDDPSTIQTTQPDVVFTAPGQTVTITLECGIG